MREHHHRHAPFVPVAAAALLLTGLLSGCAGQSASPDRTATASEEPDLRILHVNDSHSYVAGVNKHGNYCVDDAECRGGYARIAAAIEATKAERDNVLALHAGDDGKLESILIAISRKGIFE